MTKARSGMILTAAVALGFWAGARYGADRRHGTGPGLDEAGARATRSGPEGLEHRRSPSRGPVAAGGPATGSGSTLRASADRDRGLPPRASALGPVGAAEIVGDPGASFPGVARRASDGGVVGVVFVPLDQADARDDLLVDLVDAGKLDTDGAEVVRAVLDTMESDMVAARREFVDSHGDAEWGRQDVLSLRIDLTLVAADAAATLEGLVDDPLAERLDGTALDPETYLDLAMPLKIRVEP